MQRENVIAVDGEMVVGRMPREVVLSVWKPELYAATLLKEALVRQGVAVHGVVESTVAPGRTHELVAHRRGLDSTVVNLNKISDNLASENTLKTIGAERRGAPGSALSGLYEMRAFLSTLGIDTTRFQIVDGSGLSYYNLLSADMLVQLLRAMAQRPEWFPLYYASLPIAGVDGTLRTRMRGTLAENNLRAKTGSIGGVSTLSGYVTTRDGERLVFSILMQNFIGGNRAYRDAQDRIGALLASFSRRRVL
jgi:D-alanyl-D-alanine carboxypeptidase/D-alanyl-D-alanine-endopeptidase (penicillin-binding protein 4)